MNDIDIQVDEQLNMNDIDNQEDDMNDIDNQVDQHE